MCYKPRNTIMMKIAEARGWKPICGTFLCHPLALPLRAHRHSAHRS